MCVLACRIMLNLRQAGSRLATMDLRNPITSLEAPPKEEGSSGWTAIRFGDVGELGVSHVSRMSLVSDTFEIRPRSKVFSPRKAFGPSPSRRTSRRHLRSQSGSTTYEEDASQTSHHTSPGVLDSFQLDDFDLLHDGTDGEDNDTPPTPTVVSYPPHPRTPFLESTASGSSSHRTGAARHSSHRGALHRHHPDNNEILTSPSAPASPASGVSGSTAAASPTSATELLPSRTWHRSIREAPSPAGLDYLDSPRQPQRRLRVSLDFVEEDRWQ
jgi:hypothetical protein